jgi:hypothetical protein
MASGSVFALTEPMESEAKAFGDFTFVFLLLSTSFLVPCARTLVLASLAAGKQVVVGAVLLHLATNRSTPFVLQVLTNVGIQPVICFLVDPRGGCMLHNIRERARNVPAACG